MRNRKRNNIIIGTLCAVLVLMGVGYAILSTTLNIGGTANIKGDFDIHFLTEDDEYTDNNVQKRGITLIDYENSTSSNTVYKTTVSALAATMEASTGIDTQDPTKASFSAILQKPTDYATFTAIAKNYGTIKGMISTVTITSTPSQELSDWLSVNGGTYSDYFEVTTTAQQNTVLNPEGEYEFSVTVRFKESATKLPQGSLENEIVITYVQANEEQSGGNTPIDTDGWLVDANGLVTHSPSDAVQNGVLRIPAVDQNGNNIVSVDQNSFEGEYNVIVYLTNNGGYAVITDQNNYEKLSAFASTLGVSIINDVSEIPSDKTVMQTIRLNLDTSIAVEDFGEDDIRYATLNVTTLDLTSATHLTEIGTAAFLGAPIEQIIFNNVLTTIGDSAFAETKLTSVAIPSSLTTIGDDAFSGNNITTLDLSHATSLTSIGNSAFYNNSITTLDLSHATSLTSIGNNAFYDNSITTLDLSHATSLTSIGSSAFGNNSITVLNISSGLTTIGSYAFRYNSIVSVDLSNATSLTSIGGYAFLGNSITSVTIPSSVTTIGDDAFSGNNITTLDLSHATSLTSIGRFAFSDNSIITLDLSNVTNLSSIGFNAFYNQLDKNDHSIYTLQSINASNKTKAQYDAISNNNTWYDSSHSNFHIQYSDQCVGNGCN